MIAEYIDDVRTRLRAAVRGRNELEVARLSALPSAAMVDADIAGAIVPWDTHCPLCGSNFTMTSVTSTSGSQS